MSRLTSPSGECSVSLRREADWAPLGVCRKDGLDWAQRVWGAQTEQLPLSSVKPNPCWDLPQPVKSETLKAYLPGLLAS